MFTCKAKEVNLSDSEEVFLRNYYSNVVNPVLLKEEEKVISRREEKHFFYNVYMYRGI